MSDTNQVRINELARELEVSVDDLFSLQAGTQKSPESLAAEVLSAAPLALMPRLCKCNWRLDQGKDDISGTTPRRSGPWGGSEWAA